MFSVGFRGALEKLQGLAFIENAQIVFTVFGGDFRRKQVGVGLAENGWQLERRPRARLV